LDCKSLVERHFLDTLCPIVLGAQKGKLWMILKGWLEAQNCAGGCEVMSLIKELWARFNLAQEQHNADAALCFRHAIEAATRADLLSAYWWRLEGETCESKEAALVASRGTSQLQEARAE
jgi:hypothetical protein